MATRDTVSVAWISRGREQAREAEWLDVVETSALRTWIAGRKQAGVGDLLVLLDLRRKSEAPKKPYKVVIFEVPVAELCQTGRAAGDLAIWTVPWENAARSGFCVLPAARFVSEAGRR